MRANAGKGASVKLAPAFDTVEALADGIEVESLADTIEARQYRERIGPGAWRVLAAYDADNGA